MKPRKILDGKKQEKGVRRASAGLARGRRVELAGDQLGTELKLTLILKSEDESIYYVQEVGCDHKALALTVETALDLLIEASLDFFKTFLDDGELNRLSLEWRRETFDGRELKARAELTRPALDRLADALLDEG